MGLSQEEFAHKIGMKRSAYGKIELNITIPGIEIIKEIAKISGKDYQYIIDGETGIEQNQDEPQSENGGFAGGKLAGFYPPNDENDPKNGQNEGILIKNLDASKSQPGILSIVVDKSNKERVLMVPQKAFAGYLRGYADPEFIESLPTFELPMLFGGTHRAFQISGDSMEKQLYEGDWAVCKYLSSLWDVQDGTICVILFKEAGILCKRIQKVANKKIILHSINEKYNSFEAEKDDILEIWQVRIIIRELRV